MMMLRVRIARHVRICFVAEVKLLAARTEEEEGLLLIVAVAAFGRRLSPGKLGSVESEADCEKMEDRGDGKPVCDE